MGNKQIHQYQCEVCQRGDDQYEQMIYHQINVVLSRMDEQQRRWYAVVEANRHGHGGVKLVRQITGLADKTIRQGQKELSLDLAGRLKIVSVYPGQVGYVPKKRPNHRTETDGSLDPDIAGEAQTGKRWVRQSLSKIQQTLQEQKAIVLSREKIRCLLNKRKIRSKSNVTLSER